MSCEWLGLRHARLDIICRDARGWYGGIRDKLAAAISVGIENYHSLAVKKQLPMLVADYRRQTKSAPTEPVIREGDLKEADLSLINLIGKSAFPSPQQTSTPSQRVSIESAPIVP